MLSADNSARQRAAQRDVSDHLTRGNQPMPDWIGDLDARRPRDTWSESTPGDAPTRPRAATVPLPARSAGNHRALERGRRQTFWLGWLGLLAERRRLAAIVAGVAALAIAGGIFLVLSRSPSKLLASACTTTGCRQRAARRLGGTRPPAPVHKTIRPSHPAARPSKIRHSPTPSATPTPTPTSTPTASPARQPVKVSYTVVRQHPHSFQGQLTIVNDGRTAINGWELVVVLPDDDIRSVSGGTFHTNGDILYIDPLQSQRSIAPGATLTENFTAHGSTTTLTSCTFNGAAC